MLDDPPLPPLFQTGPSPFSWFLKQEESSNGQGAPIRFGTPSPSPSRSPLFPRTGIFIHSRFSHPTSPRGCCLGRSSYTCGVSPPPIFTMFFCQGFPPECRSLRTEPFLGCCACFCWLPKHFSIPHYEQSSCSTLSTPHSPRCCLLSPWVISAQGTPWAGAPYWMAQGIPARARPTMPDMEGCDPKGCVSVWCEFVRSCVLRLTGQEALTYSTAVVRRFFLLVPGRQFFPSFDKHQCGRAALSVPSSAGPASGRRPFGWRPT